MDQSSVHYYSVHHDHTTNNNKKSIQHKKNIAKRIACKRLLSNNNNNNSYYYKPNDAVYRNQSGISYKTCTFLGDADIIVVLDTNDCLDIIRIPPMIGCRYNGGQTRNNNNEHDKENNLIHRMDNMNIRSNPAALCTNIKISSQMKGDSCNKIQHIDNDIFVVGMDSGAMNIYTTERLFTSSSSSFSKKETSMFQKSTNHDFFSYIYHQAGPTRRYQRDNKYSLPYQLNHHKNSYHITTELTEIFDSNVCERSYATSIGFNRCSNSCWDFRVNSNNIVNAVHVSRYGDAFYLMTPDMRKCNSIDGTKKPNSSSVCVDMDSNGQSILSGVCFVSDHMIATSTSVNNQNNGLFTSSSIIKLWDVRFMNNRLLMKCNNRECVSEFKLSTYPDDFVFGMKSLSDWMVLEPTKPASSDNSKNKFGKDNSISELQSTHSVQGQRLNKRPLIHSITPFDDEGNILVTLGGSSNQECMIIDPIRQKVLFKNNTKSSTDDVHSYPTTGIKKESSTPMAINKSQGIIAFYGGSSHQQLSSKKTISLIQPKYGSQHHRRHNNNNSFGNNNMIPRGQKRKIDSTSETTNNDIRLDMKDRYGLQTDLSYIAFNESGTKLAGVSFDGDIFVW